MQNYEVVIYHLGQYIVVQVLQTIHLFRVWRVKI